MVFALVMISQGVSVESKRVSDSGGVFVTVRCKARCSTLCVAELRLHASMVRVRCASLDCSTTA
jgi:hypothetical protein